MPEEKTPKENLGVKKFISDSPKLNFFVGLIIGVAVVSLAGFLTLSLKGNKSNSGTDNNQPQVSGEQEQKIDLKIAETDHVLGNKDAQVKIFEFSDFQCPYCARHQETLAQLVKEYGDKVAWVFKQFPIPSHPLGLPGAMASECAAEQGKFWEMAETIFKNQETLTTDSFEKFAKDLGLDVEKFKTCVAEEKPKDKIMADYNLGINSGVGGTPTNFINNEMVPGAVPYEQLKAMIDELLK